MGDDKGMQKKLDEIKLKVTKAQGASRYSFVKRSSSHVKHDLKLQVLVILEERFRLHLTEYAAIQRQKRLLVLKGQVQHCTETAVETDRGE